MVSLNSTPSFSSLPLNRFPSPRKASASEDDELQLTEPTVDEPEAVAKTTEASTEPEDPPPVKTQQKRRGAVAQPVAPLVKPSGRNWLAYAGIGTVAGLAGGVVAGTYKTLYLPHSKIELKEGWEKADRTTENSHQISLETPSRLSVRHDLLSDKVEMWGKILKWGEKTPDGKPIKGVVWSSVEQTRQMKQVYLLEGETKRAGHLVPPNQPSFKLKDTFLFIPLLEPEKQMGFLSDCFVTSSKEGTGGASTEKLRAIKPLNTNEGWEVKLANLWSKLCLKFDNEHDILEAMKKEGYEILENQQSPDCFLGSFAVKYNSLEATAKAAVKNEKDWWKLVPHEGMGKFIAGGALAGLAVAGAGIGLWELAHKKQPSPQPKLNRQG